MIIKIDITNFGSFSGLTWQKSIRDDGGSIQCFKRLNIFYGRNYSGKTTLSRVFRALETGRISSSYPAPFFTVYGDKGDITQADIVAHDYDIRVYNRDFITENLSFLINQDNGEIKTFAIVGEKNKAIEDSIVSIEKNLGNAESKVGLKYELELKRKEQERTKIEWENARNALDDKLRNHANNEIKQNREYGLPVYNIEHIKKDINTTKKSDFKPLNTTEKETKLTLLKQEALLNISESVSIKLKIDDIKKIAEELLSRTISPTQPIQELLNDSVLQLWVKEGIPLHKNKRDTCAFCRQNLPHDIWQILDSHFSKESSDLESEIDSCLISVKSEINAIPDFVALTGERFYSEERRIFEDEKNRLTEALSTYKQDLDLIQSALEARKVNLFQTVAMPEFRHDPDAIQRYAQAINTVIIQNNERTSILGEDKDAARVALRLTDVAFFINGIKYDDEQTRIAGLKKSREAANTAYTDINNKIIALENEIIQLKNKQKDERKGADRVNELLNHFFGHDGIKLEAKEHSDKTFKFEITRSGKSAYNLSEGECTLIAFCYFIAKLEEPNSKGKDLIIYIDDPVSSLDSNHIFFIFSLIENLIAKPIKNSDGSNSYRYKQLFISTHNLDFLKYLKTISSKNKNERQYFLIERNGTASNISLMPSYLKDYITEFNYLFHQIYKCRNAEFAKENHEVFYSFGNNLRKFIEAFLFYKYPSPDSMNNKLGRFFGNDDITVTLVNRLDNELSHLEEIFDRSIKPIDIPEISKLANYVLEKIYTADPDQYNALLKSIGEPERTGGQV